MSNELNIRIVVDRERLRKTEKLRNIMAAQKGDIEAGINILAKYAVDEGGQPVPYEQARDFLLDHTGEELEQMLSAFNKAVENVAASPTSGGG